MATVTNKNINGEIERESHVEFPLVKVNFIMMGIAMAAIVLGFILMLGGGSDSQAGFNPDIFSTRRIVVGPLISFLGFMFMGFAIIYRPKSRRG
ncbi:MAG: DUF3098 domain-containing protein [Bacteroidales bacterium]|nr:DUF3098 domain-containing protein [Bacteroidales bacterium]